MLDKLRKHDSLLCDRVKRLTARLLVVLRYRLEHFQLCFRVHNQVLLKCKALWQLCRVFFFKKLEWGLPKIVTLVLKSCPHRIILDLRNIEVAVLIRLVSNIAELI